MSERSSGWGRELEELIRLPEGGKLVCLRDAASYMMDLSPAARRLLEWQSAAEALLLIVEHGGPTMFARIGVMRALNRSHVREFDPLAEKYHLGPR